MSKQANLDRVKESLSKLKECIDSAEEREIEAVQAKREGESRLEKAEEEKESTRRRLVLLQADLEKTRKNLEEKTERLEQLEDRSLDNEEKRREIEGLEIERDDKLIEVEEEAMIAKEQAAEAAHVLMETQRKLLVLETDLDKVHQRLDASEAKENEYIDTIERHSQELRDLEGRDDDAAGREMEAEEKLHFLEEQLKVEIARAEDAERDVVRNENIVISLLSELEAARESRESVGTEIGKIEDLVMELSDLDAKTLVQEQAAYE